MVNKNKSVWNRIIGLVLILTLTFSCLYTTYAGDVTLGQNIQLKNNWLNSYFTFETYPMNVDNVTIKNEAEDTTLGINFDDNTTLDSSIHNHTINQQGSPSFGNGERGEGINFNGSQSLNITTLGQTNNYSISLWINTNNQTTDNVIMDYGNYIGKLYLATDTPIFLLKNSSENDFNVTANNGLSSGWNHIVTWYNGSQMKMYINNILQDQITNVSGLTDTSNTNLYIGSENGSTLYLNNTIIDEFLFFNYSISETEIESLYNHNSSYIKLEGVSMTDDSFTCHFSEYTHNNYSDTIDSSRFPTIDYKVDNSLEIISGLSIDLNTTLTEIVTVSAPIEISYSSARNTQNETWTATEFIWDSTTNTVSINDDILYERNLSGSVNTFIFTFESTDTTGGGGSGGGDTTTPDDTTTDDTTTDDTTTDDTTTDDTNTGGGGGTYIPYIDNDADESEPVSLVDLFTQTDQRTLIGLQDEQKKMCNITTMPEIVQMTSLNEIIGVQITNNENLIFSPEFIIFYDNGSKTLVNSLRLANKIDFIETGTSETLGIKFNKWLVTSGDAKATLYITSQNCKHLEVPINIDIASTNETQSLYDILFEGDKTFKQFILYFLDTKLFFNNGDTTTWYGKIISYTASILGLTSITALVLIPFMIPNMGTSPYMYANTKVKLLIWLQRFMLWLVIIFVFFITYWLISRAGGTF